MEESWPYGDITVEQCSQRLNDFLVMATPNEEVLFCIYVLNIISENGNEQEVRVVVNTCGRQLINILGKYEHPFVCCRDSFCPNVLIHGGIVSTLFSIARYDFGKQFLLDNDIVKKCFLLRENLAVATNHDLFLLLRLGVPMETPGEQELTRAIIWLINDYNREESLSMSPSVLNMFSMMASILDEMKKKTGKCSSGICNCAYHSVITAVYLNGIPMNYIDNENLSIIRFMCHFVQYYACVLRRLQFASRRVMPLFRRSSIIHDKTSDILAVALYQLGNRDLLVQAVNKRYYSSC